MDDGLGHRMAKMGDGQPHPGEDHAWEAALINCTTGGFQTSDARYCPRCGVLDFMIAQNTVRDDTDPE